MIVNIIGFLLFFLHQVRVSLAADPCESKCTFTSGVLTSKTIGSFPTTCPRVCTSKLFIEYNSALTEPQLTTAFKNMKTLAGGLEVSGTEFTSLKFLAGLEKIESEMDYISISNNSKMVELGMTALKNISGIDFAVYDNKKMTQLNLPNLKTMRFSGDPKLLENAGPSSPGSFNTYIYIDTNHPTNFCVTGDELKTFMLSNPENILAVHGKVCPPAKFTPKICKAPAETCEELYGDLNIGAKFAVKKVQNLKILYGSIIMKNTNFTNFKFLKNLTHIVQMNQNKLIMDIQGNKKLINITFPKLQLIVCDTYDIKTSKAKDVLVFKNNNKALLQAQESCYSIAHVLHEYDMGNPKVNGLLCYELEKAPTTKKATTKKATTKKASG